MSDHGACTACADYWAHNGHNHEQIIQLREELVEVMNLASRYRAALEWVRNDAAYKAPEQMGVVARSWLSRIDAALQEDEVGG